LSLPETTPVECFKITWEPFAVALFSSCTKQV
jgi:hypothetical protein